MSFLEFCLAMLPAGIVMGHQIFQNLHNDQKFRMQNEHLSNLANILFNHAKSQDETIVRLSKEVMELKDGLIR